MKSNILEELIKRYDIEFYQSIMYIHKPILVKDFMVLKKVAKELKIKDIRIN